jgi:periplasmic protein TonB
MMRAGDTHKLKAALTVFLLFFVAACAPQRTMTTPPPEPAPVAAPAPLPAPAVHPGAPSRVEDYKALVASEIWARNAAVYAEPVPGMLKSIVVLEISIDRAGNPIGIAVYRSNGYKHLETLALESVVRAAPFPAPAANMLEGPGCVTFLETFLFRADERFQLRSLVF